MPTSAAFEDRDPRVMAMFWTCGIALVSLQVLHSCSGDIRTCVLALVVLGGAGALYWHKHGGSSPSSSSSPIVTAGGALAAMAVGTENQPDKTFDTDMYTLRNTYPKRELKHIPLRSDVVAALARLQRYARRDRGKMWRVVACLEDFYARFDAALVSSSSKRAAHVIRVLMDTRAEALNAMHSLVFARPNAHFERVHESIEVVRVSTQRCIGALWSKHGRRDPGVRAQEWRPPYALDPRKDARYHMFL